MAHRLHGALSRSLLLALVAVAGCPGPAPSPDVDSGIAPDAAPPCTATSCDDGLFCNGTERCEDGACVRGEVPGCDDGIPCTIDGCSEDARRCLAAVPDGDRDGTGDDTCLDLAGVPLGTDCDDTDPDRFPGNAERCDVLLHDEDCDDTTWGGRDADGDGHEDIACCNGALCGDDCDDASPTAHDGATEICNLIDDDCDDSVDEMVSTPGFVDADRDGRGDPLLPMTACGTAVGFSPYDDDCDDTSILRSGATPEVCDGVDNDCDLTIDEETSDVPWYRDVDGDGFGDRTDVTIACIPPPGHSLLGTDCDDANPARSPAVPELCDGLDQDCNDVADYVIAVGDLEDDDHDGSADLSCGLPRGLDCDDRDGASQPGDTESCDGRDNDCDSRVDEGVTSVAFFRDEDGDGFGDEDGAISIGCSPTTGFVRRGGDCDDGDAQRRPGAIEACNSRDDDCDVAVDEGEASTMCTASHAIAACLTGVCAVIACEPGFGDCSAADGCETRLASSTTDCSAGIDTTGLVAWLDADDPGIVVGTGSQIVQWPNRAGGPAFVAFGASPPVLLDPGGFGTGRSVQFSSGGVQSMGSIFDAQNHTIFVVARPSSTNEEDLVGTELVVGPDGEALLMFLGSTVVAHFWRGGARVQTSASPPVVTGVPVMVTQRADATTLSSYLQGVLLDTLAMPAGTTPVQPILVGNRSVSSYPSGAYQGEIAEVIVYGRALPPSEIDAVHTYLRNRWGL